MSTERNAAAVRRYLGEYVSGGSRRAAEELVHADVVFTSPYSPEPVRGRPAFLAMIDGLRASFPDLQIHEHDMLAEADRVASRWTASGTHTGAPFGGAPASGRRFSISGMSIYRLQHGRIVEGWVSDDTLGMLTQLGLIASGR